MRYVDGPRPRLFGHRGASGALPENTLEAFRGALDAGADRLELDVHATSDGEVVVIHDPMVDRTTEGAGAVRWIAYAEIARLDAGHQFRKERGLEGAPCAIPTLDAVLAAFPGVPLNIEIKQLDPPIEERVVRVLDKHGAREQVLLAAEGDEIMTRIRAAAPGVATGFTASEVYRFLQEGDAPGYRPPGFALQVPPKFSEMPIITRPFVERAHRHGVEVHAWTIDDEAEAAALLELGVDGIMSDHPARIAGVITTRRGA